MSKSIVMTIVILIVIILGGIWFASKAKTPSIIDNTDNATSTTDTLVSTMPADGSYELIASATKVEWTGTKSLIADYKDVGTIGLKEGSFAVAEGKITTGKIVFDMKTIAGEETSNKVMPIANLGKHLQSADFFDVVKFPTATFNLTRAEVVGGSNGGTFIFTGDLELKGVKNEVQFPVKFSQNLSGQTLMTGEFEIDRTKWDIKYGSTKFFQDLGDNVIADEVNVKFEATAEVK